jgi:hypothetical protein
MTTEKDRDDGHEAALAALFERSAVPPTDLERARLLARAAEVAERRARARRLRQRVVWPAALAAAAAVAYLVVAPPPTGEEAPLATPVAVATPTTPVVVQTEASGVAQAQAAPAPDRLAEAEDPVATVLGEEPGSGENDLGLLMGTEEPGSEP